MRNQVFVIAALLMPMAAQAQSTPTVGERDTITTINPGAAANFSGASYTYANTIKFNTVSGTYSGDLSVQPSASGINFAGTGGTTITPTSAANNTTDVPFSATSPGGSGQGFTFGYTGGATGFLTPTVVGGQNTLAFSGGGLNLIDTGGIFLSTVNILGNWSSLSSHTAATYSSDYTVIDNFTYSGGYTHFTVKTTNFQGNSPSISFSLLGSAVPEPASWAMMVVGVGSVGFAMRRRRNAAVKAVIA